MRTILKALLIGLLCIAAVAASAQGPLLVSQDGTQVLPRFPVGTGKIPLPAAAREGAPAILMVELPGEPAIQAFLKAQAAGSRAQAVKASQTRIAAIKAAQDTVRTEIQKKAPGTEVLYTVQRTFNGMVVRTSGKNYRAIAAVKGVKAVHVMRPKTIENSTSVPFVSVLAAWQYYGNYTGAGIKMGIVDSGIDYIHVALGGSGLSGTYSSNDPTTTGDVADYPNTRVVGGTDLVGDTYDGTSTAVAVPDDDPMDLDGHGTHVASTAAGWGVNSDGSAYSGPWNVSVPFDTMRVGPGMAPEAQLYAVKIFGPTGGTYYVVQGIEWCVDPDGNGDYSDKMDVVNMSVGSPYGGDFESDTVAMNNAVELGVFFACSAGNSGDTYYVTGSPGMASRAISTASSLDMYSATAINVTSPSSIAGNYACQPADIGPPLDSTGFSGNVVMAVPADASSALTNAAQISGNIALIDRGNINYLTKIQNAQDAGAIAVIVANNADDNLWTMVTSDDDSSITIPSVFIGLTDGNTLKANLPGVVCNTNLLIEMRDTTFADTMSDFSSRGPASSFSRLKPDITAPGSSIMSAGAGTGKDPARMSGTSMASPHVAGAGALMRQAHPDWTPEEIKAALMNTAQHYLYSDANHTTPTHNTSRTGTGCLDMSPAMVQNVIAYCSSGAPGAVSLSYGAPEVTSGTVGIYDHTVQVVDKGEGGGVYSAIYNPVFDAPGVAVSILGPTTFTLPTSGTAIVSVRVTVTGSDLRHWRDSALVSTQGGNPRAWICEETGHVKIFQIGGSLRGSVTQMWLPLHAAPRPGGTMETVETAIDLSGGTGTMTLNTTGIQVNTGSSYPEDIIGLTYPFELTHQSPDDAVTSGELNFADIKHVGVHVPDLGASPEMNDLYFGVSTWGDIASPNMCEVDIMIDSQRDGSWDYVAYTIDGGSLYGEDYQDVFLQPLYNLTTGTWTATHWAMGGYTPAQYDMYAHNTNLRTFWIGDPKNMGVRTGQTQFDYQVRTYFWGVLVDQTPTLTYDAAAPGLRSDAGAYADLPNQTMSIAYDQTAFNNNASEGLLIQHRHNKAGMRSQILLPVGVGTPTPTPTPTVTPTSTATPTTPPADTDIETGQAISIVSTGAFWAMAWNYGTNSSGGTLSNTGAGTLNYSISSGDWVGIYVYDFDTASYNVGLYIYNEDL